MITGFRIPHTAGPGTLRRFMQTIGVSALPAPTQHRPLGGFLRRMGFNRFCTSPVHNGVMKVASKAVRQSVSLPPRLAKEVGSMAKTRKLSRNRMLVELIENGIDAEKQKQKQFFALAERFRNERDPEAANRLGDELGRMVFGG